MTVVLVNDCCVVLVSDCCVVLVNDCCVVLVSDRCVSADSGHQQLCLTKTIWG